MNKNQELIDEVIEEIKLQIADNDWTVIEGLLTFVPKEKLVWFLPEEKLKNYKESRLASLQHWEKCFRDGTVDDEHSEFIAGVLAKAREDFE